MELVGVGERGEDEGEGGGRRRGGLERGEEEGDGGRGVVGVKVRANEGFSG